MKARCTILSIKPAFRHSLNSLNLRSPYSLGNISAKSFRFPWTNVFLKFTASRPVIGKQSDPRFFDPSVKLNPDILKAQACERAIGYQFHEPLLLWEALQTEGPYTQLPRYLEGNKRLAILGDKILDLLLALKWYPTWATRRMYLSLKSRLRIY